MSRVALLPLDDRPATYDFPRWLGEAAGLDVLAPPRDWLGNPWRPGATDRLSAWLAETAPTADGLIVSIDTLGYGGLVASRRTSAAAAETIARLEVLRTLRDRHPSLRILAFSVLMRVNRSDSAEEEKPYCATYGRQLFRLSYVDHKRSLGEANDAEGAELASLVDQLPADVVDDYRAGRARGDAVTRAMVGWLGEGVFDYLLVVQDDTAEYGWNIAEARNLRRQIEGEGLSDRASVYPGADEAASLLVARFACRNAGFVPRVWPRYSGFGGAGVRTAYEDRPVEELLKAHLGPLGGTLAAGPGEADLVLAVNAPAEVQADALWQPLLGEQPRIVIPIEDGRPALDAVLAGEGARATHREMDTAGRSLDEFVRMLRRELDGGLPVAVADLAFVNGADLALGERLLRHVTVAQLAGFAGWNTAGNSLGTALAQGVIRALGLREGSSRAQLAAHLGFLLLRFVDDIAYQSLERTGLLFVDLPALGILPTMEQLPTEVRPRMTEHLNQRLGPHVAAWSRAFEGATISMGPAGSVAIRRARLSRADLPWDRLFEVGLRPDIELA